jgi:hypothetical protein
MIRLLSRLLWRLQQLLLYLLSLWQPLLSIDG